MLSVLPCNHATDIRPAQRSVCNSMSQHINGAVGCISRPKCPSLQKSGGHKMRQFSVIAIVGLMALASLMQPAFGQEPIKIGVMFPLTGPVSAQGAPERDAIKQAFEEENNIVAGRKI